MDPTALMYNQYCDMTRRFFPQFLSLLPATPPPPPVRTPPQSPAPPANESNIIFVEGDAGAAAYQVPAGSQAVFFDSQTDRVYIKKVDPDGKPHTKVSDLNWQDFRSPDDPANRFVSREDFQQFKAELTAALKQIADNASAQSQKEGANNA